MRRIIGAWHVRPPLGWGHCHARKLGLSGQTADLFPSRDARYTRRQHDKADARRPVVARASGPDSLFFAWLFAALATAAAISYSLSCAQADQMNGKSACEVARARASGSRRSQPVFRQFVRLFPSRASPAAGDMAAWQRLGPLQPLSIHHRSAAVCTGASHRRVSSASSAVTVSEHPAISSEVQ